MKKILTAALVVVALMMSTTLKAQDKFVTFGVKAGLNLSNMSGDVDGDIKPGFNAGVTVDLRLMPNLYLLSGLEYSLEGTKSGDAKLEYSYLKLPLHVGYKLPVMDNMKIVFHAGPHLAYGLSGKSKYKGEESYDLYDVELGVKGKRFDLGLGFGVGAEVSNFCFNVGCDFGLLNQFEFKGLFDETEWDIADKDINAKNMNINISVGYKF